MEFQRTNLTFVSTCLSHEETLQVAEVAARIERSDYTKNLAEKEGCGCHSKLTKATKQESTVCSTHSRFDLGRQFVNLFGFFHLLFRTRVNRVTLWSLIDVPPRLLIFGKFSTQDILIPTPPPPRLLILATSSKLDKSYTTKFHAPN